MFRIKICGITNPEDAHAAMAAGADAIGLNFYEMSPRRVSVEDARKITWGLDPQPRFPVGVFVNMSPTAIQEIVTQLALPFIQLHGDETPDLVAQCAAVKLPPTFTRSPHLIRARRMDDQGVSAIASDLDKCGAAGAWPAAVLVDALTPGRYGGTGETVSWVGLADHKKWLGDTPLILAGGLTPDNVAEAIRIVRPHAVDVASGVESAPGKKDPHKVRDFIAAAKAGFGV